MLSYEVAYVRIRRRHLILVPVHVSFAGRPHPEQLAALAALQRHADRAGLGGTVVPVWQIERGRMTFFARPSLHRLVEVLNWEDVVDSLNHRLIVGRRVARCECEETVASAT
jgi:hypothetical protein